MKILVNATVTAAGAMTGIERFSLRISQELCRIDRKVEVLSSLDLPGVALLTRSRVLTAAGKLLDRREYLVRALWDQTCLRYHLLKSRPDLVYFPIQEGLLFPPVRQVVTVHDLHYRHFKASLAECRDEINPCRTGLNRLRMPHVLGRSAAVIAVSESTRQDLIASFGLAAEKVHVIYNGYDEARFRPIEDPGPVLRRLGVQREGYFLFVGSILRHKNLARLVQAYAQLSGEARLVLVGACKDAGYLREVKEAARELGISEARIVYLEYVPDEDLPHLYNGAIACVLPSLHEGFGVPVIEAMACGTPVIASNCSALPEVAGNAALLVDPYSVPDLAQVMQSVAASQRLRLELRCSGLARAGNFRWSTSASKLYEIFAMVVGDRKNAI